jgi:hypothetical protein
MVFRMRARRSRLALQDIKGLIWLWVQLGKVVVLSNSRQTSTEKQHPPTFCKPASGVPRRSMAGLS